MRRLISTLLFLCALPLQVAAQVPVPDICSTAFSQGIHDNYGVLSKEYQFTLFKDRILSLTSDTFQNFTQSAKAVGLNIESVYGILGLTGSDDEKAQQFSSHFNDFKHSTYSETQYSQFFQSNQAVIDQGLLDSWRKCSTDFYNAWRAANSTGVSASIGPVAGLGIFVVTLHISPPVLSSVKITGINPIGLLQCASGAGMPVVPDNTMITTADWSMTCYKDPALEFSFNVSTAAGQSSFVKLPKATSDLDELRQTIDGLRAILNGLKSEKDQQIAALNAQVANLDTKQSSAIKDVADKIPHRVILVGDRKCGASCDAMGFQHPNNYANCPGSDQVVSGAMGGLGTGELYLQCRQLTLSPWVGTAKFTRR
jgi:hypothetical protein